MGEIGGGTVQSHMQASFDWTFYEMRTCEGGDSAENIAKHLAQVASYLLEKGFAVNNHIWQPHLPR